MQNNPVSAPASPAGAMSLIKMLGEGLKARMGESAHTNGVSQEALLGDIARCLSQLSARGCSADDALAAMDQIMTGFNRLKAAIEKPK